MKDAFVKAQVPLVAYATATEDITSAFNAVFLDAQSKLKLVAFVFPTVPSGLVATSVVTKIRLSHKDYAKGMTGTQYAFWT